MTERVITLDQQIACLARELAVRETCYPKWVKEHRMLQSKADHEIAAMRESLATLKKLKEKPECSNSN